MTKSSPLLVVLVLASCCFSTQQAGAQASDAIAGTWFGTFVVSNPDGRLGHDTAVLIVGEERLKLGTGLSGSMGRTIDQQTAWDDGSFRNDQLKFHLDAAGGLNVVLTLHREVLTGTAVGQRMNEQIELKPAPGLLPHQQLEQEIMAADRQLYEAFENCDVAGYSRFLSKDLEFYRDNTGKSGYDENLKALENRCAEGIKLRRELDADSVIVNAAPGIGAIQAGIRRFYSRGQDGEEHLDATARFTNVWSKESGSWKLVRVISYDHR